MGIFGLFLLISMHVVRIAVSLYEPSLFRPATISHFGAVVLYIVPLAGTLLFFSALLLLYFERIKEDLLRSLAAKEQALETQLRFIDMFSHEYRTPLAVIRTNLDILQTKDQSNGDRFASNLGKMRRAVLRLVEVAETVLVAEQRDDSGTVVRRERISGPDFLRNILDEASVFWSERAPQLQLVCVEPIEFIGDRILLKTAVLNLLDNAIKYGHEKCVISATLTANDKVVTIVVADNGPGIPAHELDQVFGKYFRGSHAGLVRGNGVGLYLVQRIIEQHFGSVSLSNRVAGGVAATISLPLHAGGGQQA
jgi:signal transduction histidine kinase